MKKKFYKLISCLLAVVLMMTILLPSVVMASEEEVVNSADKDEPKDLEVSIAIKDAKDSPVKIPRNQDEDVAEELKNLPKKNLPENIIEESGEGTPEDPKETTTTTVVEDEENKETTTTVKKEKEWQDDNIMGNEDSKNVETVDENGNLFSDSGEAQGKETTTIKDEKDTEVKVE